mmetsp:Transcript_27774/g.38798  ORF Transcript_27774/g.38798 Transcript_27774/m.38798 type:complete len:131 (+) Transcript_27774:85-477(+)
MNLGKIISKLWRAKSGKIIKIIQKIRGLKLKEIKKNKSFKNSMRIDLGKKHGFKKDRKHIVVVTKVSKRKNKRKARKGKIFGKLSSQGCIKRKKKISLLKMASNSIPFKSKSYTKLKTYWVLEVFKLIKG